MFRLARGVQIEECRPTRRQTFNEPFNHVTRVRDCTLQDIGRAMRHADEADFLAGFFLAFNRLAELRHVRYLADKARCAGLATGI